MPDQTPRGREKHVTQNGHDVYKRGQGLGTGPVGNRKPGSSPLGSTQRPSGTGNGNFTPSANRSTGTRRSNPLLMIIAAAVVLLGGGTGLFSMGSGNDAPVSSYSTPAPAAVSTPAPVASSVAPGFPSSHYNVLMNGQGTGSSWNTQQDTGVLNSTVASGSRQKYTNILGNGKDINTILVYMCGTDLESKSAMGSRDLQEMASASFDEHVNLIIYTGGCSEWKVSGISNQTNQIYQIKNGQMLRLEKNMGSKSMTSPATLTEFLNYGKEKFPANRYDLILWDHGGGSVSGYGYDQKFPSTGSMTLSGIRKALQDANMKFDFIGFDACLMATAENALMLADYADYLVASEETEPGIGWYYTGWLSSLGKNPSLDTLTLGKQIVDDFVAACSRSCAGQLTTLSVIDLAEFSHTVPEKLKAFASSTTELIQAGDYTQVATARQSTREFAVSTKIDQCDLVDLAKRIDTDASRDLAKTLQSAIKYNRTSSNMTNAYGVSIYFPNRKLSSVDKAVAIDDAIGMDSEFSSCIKAYASLQLSGQTVASGTGNTGSPYGSLFGSLYGYPGSSSSSAVPGASSYGSSSSGTPYGSTGTADMEMVSQLLNLLLGGGSSGNSYLSGRSISDEVLIDFVTQNQFDSSLLVWQQDAQGNPYISLPASQWQYVTGLEQNMFFDDGEGFIDLGCDNLFTIRENGDLAADADGTWLAIDGHPAAYYHLSTVEDGDYYCITGYIPAIVNGERTILLVVFDSDRPYGYISGYCTDYHDGETETVAKANGQLEPGDRIDLICDYYSYDGEYQDSYYLGDSFTAGNSIELSNVPIRADAAMVTYKFTDIYGYEYWTPVMP